jgi:DNA-binding NtrC family response regulator
MAEPAQQKSETTKQEPDTDFRWQALFQRTAEPLFLLNRRRRFLFVNRAWEELTGLSAVEARGLQCLRRPSAPQDPWDLVIRAVCCPPPEVLQGKTGRARRLVLRNNITRCWWDIDFFPLHEQERLICILGKITVVSTQVAATHPPLPEQLMALREAMGQRYRFDLLAGSSPAWQRILEQVRLAAHTHIPVLILGEAGTGKHWVARTIHHQGTMREGTFAALDCARLPPALLTTLLLGGSEPGPQPGGGTRYLKEPSLLSRELQTQLCAFLKEAPRSAPVRIIAGCSADPLEEVRADRLAEEFYCTLSTLTIALPPLRERQADLPILVERFLERINYGNEKPIAGLTPEALDLLRAHTWPGNLRELYAVLQGSCRRTTSSRIDVAHLPARLRLTVRLEQMPQPEAEHPLNLDDILQQAERRLIVSALRKARGNRSRAAELLSIWRPRLLRRMEALGINEW